MNSKTFVVISKHFGDAEWIKNYTNNYIIYDKSIDPLGYRSIRIPNVGYNLLAYFSYIIDHYENLPEILMLIKNNCIGRHFSKEYFESVMSNEHFTPLVEKELLQFRQPDCYWADGYHERNNLNMYFNLRYVRNINEMFDFAFEESGHYPEYIRFAPGANYIIPKGQILRLPKSLYQDLRTMVEHHQLSGESHIIERCLDTFWTKGKVFKPTRFIKTL